MAPQSPRIGYVLSSGGIRGVYAHTGFLLALDALKLPVVAGAGCSAGAVVGGIAASGTNMESWCAALSAITRKNFWTPDPLWRFLWNMTIRHGRGYTGLSDTSAAMEFCRQNMVVQTFEECLYPFYTVAVSLSRSEKELFSEGELAPRMVASAAMPILYRPVEIEGDLFCDGALIDLAPTDAICCKQSLDVLIVHHVSQQIQSDPSGLENVLNGRWTLIQLLNRMLYHHRPWYLTNKPVSFTRCPCGCGAVVVVLEPDLAPFHWPLTDGGAVVIRNVAAQVQDLLAPYCADLVSDPRKKFSVFEPGQTADAQSKPG